MVAIPVQTEQVYGHRESIGIAVLVGCGLLSLISVMSMFTILGVSATRSHRSSDETPFVRTYVAVYFLSLLLCNLVQGVGALLNIPWIVEKRVYIGTLCTTQATIKQIGNIGTAIFSFVIAAHTFSLLFLGRQWPNRTRYTVLIASWCLLVLDLCVENFIVADPAAKGPYYGISGYWCWITPAYSTERYTSEYLFMFVSAGFSFVLYSLVFLRLRGNITHSGGPRIYFHQRPKVRVGRTSTGTYISTDDRRVESHLTTVAKQMLWYPIAYTVLVLPIGATRFYTTSHAAVPFSVTISTAALLMLSGFVNTVLFCTTRSVLPSGWRQRFSIGTAQSGGPDDVSWSSWGNSAWRRTESGGRKGPAGAGRASFVIDINVAKDIAIKYDNEPGPSSLKYGSPTAPSWPLRAYSGEQRTDAYSYHIGQPLYPPIRDRWESVSLRVGGEDGDSALKDGVLPESKAKIVDETMLPHPVHATRRHERGMSAPTMGLDAPVSTHRFSAAYAVNTNTRPYRLPDVQLSR